MTRTNGSMLVCDVCGKSVFCKLKATGTADGGWSQWNDFDAPGDWKTHYNGYKDVCPSCHERIETAIKREVDCITDETITEAVER